MMIYSTFIGIELTGALADLFIAIDECRSDTVINAMKTTFKCLILYRQIDSIK